jgi:hypothetical protein
LSSFKGGTASNACCSVRDPTLSDPLATRPIIVGIDSYSDITVAHRDIAYAIRPISETVHTGAGEASYSEEGLVDIVDGPESFRTIPALIAQNPDQLPTSTHLLLGVTQINELDVKCDVHRTNEDFPCNPTTRTPISLSTLLYTVAWPRRTYFSGQSATPNNLWAAYSTPTSM